MGVMTRTYVIYGFRVPEFRDFHDTVWEEAYDPTGSDRVFSHNGISIVADGMNGKYTVIGKILRKTDAMNVFDEFLSLSDDLFPVIEDLSKEEGWQKNCRSLLELSEDEQPDLLIFTHWA